VKEQFRNFCHIPCTTHNFWLSC